MEKVKLIIDGLEITAQERKTVLEAALENGIYIPHLCHHPDLKPAGICRVCLVEVNGQMLVSCRTPAEDGMVVKTTGPVVDKVRRVAVELLVADHHADCLACGKNNDCKLQEITRYVGVASNRLEELKARELQPVDDSHPFIIRDHNKCVLCGICVRTCDEVQGAGAINFAFRGYAARISTFGDKPLRESTCESCGECMVRCPVGALLPRGFEQPAREVKTVCPYCGTGCGIILGARGNKVVSARGNPEQTTNRGRLCVKGRFGWSFINSQERLTKPLIKKEGKFVEAGWEEALNLIVEKFSRYRGEEAAVFGSPKTSNEEIYLASKFARVVMGTNNIANVAHLCHANTVRGLLPVTGSGGMTVPISQIKETACHFVIGCNPTEGHPIIGLEIRQAVKNGAKLIIANPREISLCRLPHVRLALRPGTDVALLMGMARVILEEGLEDKEFIEQRTNNFAAFKESLADFTVEKASEITGVPVENIRQAARVYAAVKPGLIYWSMGITQHSHGHDNVWSLAHLAMMTGNYGRTGSGVAPLRGHNNVQGATDMGASPPWYPGYQYCPGYDLYPRLNKFTDSKAKFEEAWGYKLPDFPGFSTMKQFNPKAKGWGPEEMWDLENKIKAWYIIGSELAVGVAEADNVKKTMDQAEFVVVQDIFLTETAKLADVILPAACFAEKDGTFTATDRLVQRIRKVVEPPGEAKPDWWIICELARRLGYKGFDFIHPAQIMDEIASVVPSHAGLSYDRLEREELWWPCPDKEHPGTPVLHVDKFIKVEKGEFWPMEYTSPPELPDPEYPLLMTTGRSITHFHFVMTRKVEGLNQLCPEDYVEINPIDAEALGIKDGDAIKVTSRRASVLSKARVRDSILPGVVFKTIHFNESPTNRLTSSAVIDPVGTTPNTKVCPVRIEKG
jgi:formate dehydrogenase alpha subunit